MHPSSSRAIAARIVATALLSISAVSGVNPAVVIPAVAVPGVAADPASATGPRAEADGRSAECVTDDAVLEWGFKESFRAYVSGSIANGEWTVLDGAEYETPDFRFDSGVGSLDPRAHSGEFVFEGGIRFTGHDGILDTTVSDPVVRIDDARSGVLVLDVRGTTQQGDEVDARSVEFLDLELEPIRRDGTTGELRIVSATLTDEGARAFGTYPAGEQFDPAVLSLPVAGDCALDDPFAWWPWWIAAGVLAVAVAAVAAIALRSRRAGGSSGGDA